MPYLHVPPDRGGRAACVGPLIVYERPRRSYLCKDHEGVFRHGVYEVTQKMQRTDVGCKTLRVNLHPPQDRAQFFTPSTICVNLGAVFPTVGIGSAEVDSNQVP